MNPNKKIFRFHDVIDFKVTDCDRNAALSELERAYISNLPNTDLQVHPRSNRFREIARIVNPLRQYCDYFGIVKVSKSWLIREMLLKCGEFEKVYWGWSDSDWLSLDRTVGAKPDQQRHKLRQHVYALAYHLNGQIIYPDVPDGFLVAYLAYRLWGRRIVDAAINKIKSALVDIGYSSKFQFQIDNAMARMMIILREPDITKWDETAFIEAHKSDRFRFQRGERRHGTTMIWNALHHIGVISQPVRFISKEKRVSYSATSGVNEEWLQFTERYISKSVREDPSTLRGFVLYIGKWLAKYHPQVTNPGLWTGELALEFREFICGHARVGEFVDSVDVDNAKPLTPHTKKNRLNMARSMFLQIFEWEWYPRRFDPRAAFKVPAHVNRQAGPKPRDLQDDVWAKLLYAGVNLKAEDFSENIRSRFSIELLQAVAINWLFGGLRHDELRRLGTQCVSWEYDLIDDTGPDPSHPICYLTVPPNKYKPEFKKPVDGIIGKAIEAWLAVRPAAQKPIRDRKTGELEDKLFSVRGRIIGERLLPDTIIPKLCELAGVPLEDAKGRITTHRARSTIATQLVNADQPMTLLELRDWLGHNSIKSTEFYANQRPKKLAKKFKDADYFRQNVARITILLDRTAIESGAAASGKPYMQYDLGHGYCGDKFFSRCPHRLACTPCSFYTPKDSALGQMLEADEHNMRLSVELPLRPEEKEALEGDAAAMRRLRAKLKDVPTNDGRTPRQILATPSSEQEQQAAG